MIYENAANKLNLKEIAEREYVSVQYLSKEFNEKIHINFKTTVEYSSTAVADKLMPILETLSDWGEEMMKLEEKQK